MPIGVPTSAPSSRPSKASETVASRWRHISPLVNSVRSLSPIKLGRLLQNSLNRCPAEYSQISSSPTIRPRRQSQIEMPFPEAVAFSSPGPPGRIISSEAAGSVIGSVTSRQITNGDDICVGEFLHRGVGDPQHFKRGLESGLLRTAVMRQASLRGVVSDGNHKLRRQ